MEKLEMTSVEVLLDKSSHNWNQNWNRICYTSQKNFAKNF